MRVNGQSYRSVWREGPLVRMIDQRLLPGRFQIFDCPGYADTAEAIRDMTVRGAGAIGVAAGYALAQAAQVCPEKNFLDALDQASQAIRNTRPTARDLFYAVDRVEAAARAAPEPAQGRQAAWETADRLADANAAAAEQIGRVGEPLIGKSARILTQCNAGWLAFADWGSALAPIYLAHRNGKQPSVFVPETRPRGQGARLTAWELGQEGVPHTLIADTAIGWLMQKKEVEIVIVGADRIAANGDTANKIGTYTLALLARQHRIPFYVAAPRSTFDPATPTGAQIPIEERTPDEVHWVWGTTDTGEVRRVRISPVETPARNPAFDVTPADLITAFITESGLIQPKSGLL